MDITQRVAKQLPAMPLLPTDNIRQYYTKSCHTITTDAIITDGLSIGN